MKKVVLLLCIFAIAMIADAQPFKRKITQKEANDKLAYVFGYLKSDTMTFKNMVLPDPNTKVVMMHDVYGNALYVLITSEVFDTTNAQISRLSEREGIYGLEFTLTYLSSFSWQNRKSIRKIDDPYQKAITKVFNTKVKYCLMQQGAQEVRGRRILDPKLSNYGKIVPDFSLNPGSTNAVAAKKTNTPAISSDEKKKKNDEAEDGTEEGTPPAKKKTTAKPAEKTRNFGGG
jgi:hypothetical protein